jgi:hypothetical protein
MAGDFSNRLFMDLRRRRLDLQRGNVCADLPRQRKCNVLGVTATAIVPGCRVFGLGSFDLIEGALFRLASRRRLGFVATLDAIRAPIFAVARCVFLSLPQFGRMLVS